MILKNSFKVSRSQQGIALIIVLWMLALLTIIALSYSNMSRTETLLISNTVHIAQARSKAESAIWLAVNDLLKPLKSRQYSQSGMTTVIYSSVEDSLKVIIQDESGKIDLNKASSQLLHGMFTSINIDIDQANQLVDVILDWRDRDDLTRVNGAEDKDYLDSGFTYGAKDGVFNSIGELRQVKGMTSDLYEKIAPLVTIHSMQSRVRLSSATPGVLNALPDLPIELKTQILDNRTNNEADIIVGILPDTLKPLVFISGVGRNIYSINAEAQVQGIYSNLRVILALKKKGNRPMTILDWQENVASFIIDSHLQENVLENELDL